MKLFVGNLPVSTSESDLEDLFSVFGKVTSAHVVRTRFSGRSRGFGFVEMLPECGKKAVSELDGGEIDCMLLHVNEAKKIGT